jgi:hypothetical protein
VWIRIIGARMRTPATRLEGALVVAVAMGDIGRGAAHVEADDLVEARKPCRLDHADDAAGRAGQDRILALEHVCGRQSAGRHHEHQAGRIFILRLAGRVARSAGRGWRRKLNSGQIERAASIPNRRLRRHPFRKGEGRARAQLPRHLAHIAREDRRKVGVDDGGVAAPDELDQRRDHVAHRYLREAEAAAQFCGCLLVLRKLPGMHEDDGDRVDAVGPGLLDQRRHAGDVQRRFHPPIGPHAFLDLDHALVELLGKDDLLGKDVGTRLVGDLQRVAKPLGDQKQDAVALALEQRIGRDGRAHLDLADHAVRHGRTVLQPEQVADALDRRVAIGFRILRQELSRMQASVGRPANDVGKGPAAVYPEIPGSAQSSLPPCATRQVEEITIAVTVRTKFRAAVARHG